jgi:hypothetical protein
MAPLVVGLDGEDQPKMSYFSSGQSDRFQCISSIHVKLFNLRASIAEFWRALAWPTPPIEMKLQLVPVRTPRRQRHA